MLSQKSWALALSLCILIHGGIIGIALFQNSSVPKTSDENSTSVRVLTLNMHNDTLTLNPTAQMIGKEDPTLILLSEIPENHASFLESLERYPYRVIPPSVNQFDILLLSQWPIKNWWIDRTPPFLPILITEICPPKKPETCFSLIGLHMPPPLSKISNHLQKHMFHRLAQVSKNFKVSPLVIMGDLNATPWSPMIQKLITQLGLHSTAGGREWQTTWFSRNPILGLHIDHILGNQFIVSKKWWVGPHVGSDHFPVFADLNVVWP